MGKLTAALILSALLDWGSTCWGFNAGLMEANPLVAPVVGTSCTKVGLLKATHVGVTLIGKSYLERKGHKKLAKWLTITVTVSNTGAAVWNTIQIGK